MHNQNTLKFTKTRLHCTLLHCLHTPTYQFAGLGSFLLILYILYFYIFYIFHFHLFCRPEVTWRRPQGEMITVRQGENKRKSKKQVFFCKGNHQQLKSKNIKYWQNICARYWLPILTKNVDCQFWLKMLTTNFEFWYWLSLFMQSDTASFLVAIEQNGWHTDQVALAHLKICFT